MKCQFVYPGYGTDPGDGAHCIYEALANKPYCHLHDEIPVDKPDNLPDNAGSILIDIPTSKEIFEAHDEILNQIKQDKIRNATPGIGGVLQQRGSIYGDIRDNMNCAKQLIGVIKYYYQMNPKSKGFQFKSVYDETGFQGCLEMVCHKLARIVTGYMGHEDNYIDVAGYIELARKIVTNQLEPEKVKDK